MIILLTGATGFIGRTLSARLAAEGHDLRILTRRPDAALASLPLGTRAFAWPSGGPVPHEAVAGADAVVHLAGESIGEWPWTADRKRRILESRVQGTRALVEAMARAGQGAGAPAVFVAASAVGYYGDGGDAPRTEAHPPGKGFLAEVCIAWEREIFRAREAGIRTVAIRNGLVLGRGGVMAKLLPVYRLGGGAVLGSGRQWWSWAHVEDTAGIFAYALGNGALEGPVNGCAPQPVTQREFARALARAVHRPLLFKAPAFALRLALGEMASTLLDGQKTAAAKLSAGYDYRYRSLDAALADIVSGG